MKKTSFSFNLLVAAIAFAGFAFTVSNTVSYSVNTASSTVAWKGYKVTGEHNGNINLKSGALTFDNGMLTGGSFEIDMASIKCNDLQGEWADKLVGHLKSDDFFGVEKYPTSKFVITKVVSRGTPGSYKVTGNLTIKETTKEIKFDANVSEEAGNYVATADIKVDRSEYNVRYGSGSFFDNLGDKTIYDEFDMSVKVVTKK
ncbi:MAG: YceI family protein [Lewinellaceae bacterium]|nr:YceI family protein [Saprospiraceae bacterium]MCB9340851.1 YceI family protein [Lewinellaceae bacterium]